MSSLLQRSDAKLKELPRYFTGKPCSRGHIALRTTINGSCCECQRLDKQKKRAARNPDYRTRTQMDADRVAPTRVCTACKKKLPNTVEFFVLQKDKRRKKWTGLSSECRVCRRGRFIEWYGDNTAYAIARATTDTKARRATPKGKEKERIWALNGYYRRMEDPDNRVQHRQNERNWRKENPNKVKLFKWNQPHLKRLVAMNRFAAKLNATPPWLTAKHFAQIERIYLRADKRTQETGVKHDVDHYYPLQGRTSRGLHVPWNLRIIPKAENQAKANRDPIEFYKEKRRNRK